MIRYRAAIRLSASQPPDAVATISRDGFGGWRRFTEIALNGLRPEY